MSVTGRRWVETAQVRHPRMLRLYRITLAIAGSAWFGWSVVGAIGSGDAAAGWAVVAGLVAGGLVCASLAAVPSERVSHRTARGLYVAGLGAACVLTGMLLEGGLAARGFSGAAMLCYVGLIVVAYLTGRPRFVADGFARRVPPTLATHTWREGNDWVARDGSPGCRR